LISFTELILLILALILGASSSEVNIGKILLYLSSFTALTIPIIYFYIGIKTSGETRTRSMGAGVGFLIAFIGIIINTFLGRSIARFLLGVFWGNIIANILYGGLVVIGLTVYYKYIKY
jgi:hypothetical protein